MDYFADVVVVADVIRNKLPHDEFWLVILSSFHFKLFRSTCTFLLYVILLLDCTDELCGFVVFAFSFLDLSKDNEMRTDAYMYSFCSSLLLWRWNTCCF